MIKNKKAHKKTHAKAHKKAQLSFLQTLIITIVVCMVISATTIILVDKVKKMSDIELCRISVFGKAESKKLTVGQESLTNLQCFTRYVDVRGNGIYVNSETKKGYDIRFESSSNRPEIAKRFVADELRHCWYQMGEGAMDPFGAQDAGLSPLSDDSHCVICSEIQFSDKSIPMDSFTDILKQKMTGSQSTYNDYLYKGQEVLKLDYNTSKTYAIVWVVVNKNSWNNQNIFYKIFTISSLWSNPGLMPNPGAFFAMLEMPKANRQAYVYTMVIPLDDVSAQCDRMY